MEGSFRAALSLAAALVLSSLVLSSSYLKAKKLDQTVRVTGSAKKRIKSDLMIWSATVNAEGATLADAYAKLSRDVEKTRVFLVAQGFPENQIAISAISTNTLRAKGSKNEDEPTGKIVSYQLKQALWIRSVEIDKLTEVSRRVTQLINQGILLESAEPEYLYTRLAETKVVILAEAAKDAKERAQQIASSTGSRVGEIRSAEMGVLQITSADANNVSDYGENDTKSLEKDVSAVVHVTFAIE
jgi:hypothetical protein